MRSSHRNRSASILLITLSLVLVMGFFAATLSLLSRSAHREVDALGNHLQAISISETVFSEVVARLQGTPWSKRWFRSNPEQVLNRPLGEGVYSSLIWDAPDAPRTAHLLVKSTLDRSKVVMFWRLMVPEDDLDSFARVVPIFFQFLPDDVASTPQSIDQVVLDIIDKRKSNRSGLPSKRSELNDANSAPDIITVMGNEPPGPVLDEVPSSDTSSTRPNPPYIDEIKQDSAALPPALPLPAPPPPAMPPSDPPGPPPPPPGGGRGGGDGGGSAAEAITAMHSLDFKQAYLQRYIDCPQVPAEVRSELQSNLDLFNSLEVWCDANLGDLDPPWTNSPFPRGDVTGRIPDPQVTQMRDAMSGYPVAIQKAQGYNCP